MTAPALPARARRAADLAQQILAVMKQMQAQMAAQNPTSTEPPSSTKPYVALNREFVAEMLSLRDACPA